MLHLTGNHAKGYRPREKQYDLCFTGSDYYTPSTKKLNPIKFRGFVPKQIHISYEEYLVVKTTRLPCQHFVAKGFYLVFQLNQSVV